MKDEYTKNYKILLTEVMVNWLSTKLPRWLNGKRTLFVTNGAGKTGYQCGEKRTLTFFSHIIYKINSKWNTDLNIRAKTIKPLEENIGERLYDTESGNDLLEYGTKAQVINNKLEFIKIKKAFASKDTINRVKRWLKEWKRTFSNLVYD